MKEKECKPLHNTQLCQFMSGLVLSVQNGRYPSFTLVGDTLSYEILDGPLGQLVRRHLASKFSDFQV